MKREEFLFRLKGIKTPFDSVISKFLGASFKRYPDMSMPVRFDYVDVPLKLVMFWVSVDGKKTMHVEVNEDFVSYLFTEEDTKTTVSCAVNEDIIPRGLCDLMCHFRQPN